ncbi:MAG: TonB family protein [Brevundimonas sp.]|uniref:TonB family protein n=1 Tax=Brevundimonas sp. TaxID=1871086 RepID=UPI004034C7A4
MLALIAVATGALSSSGPIIESPSWSRTPTAEEFSLGRRTGLPPEGAVTLSCMVRADGLLEACVVESVAPAQSRLDEEALRLTQYYRHKPRFWDGRPVVGAKVRFTIRWRDQP